MRLFLAIDLPDKIKEDIVKLYPKLRKAVYGKFVEKENLHITLFFFGEVTPKEKEKIVATLKEIEYPTFKVRIKDLGAFPNENNPRVVWLGVSSNYLYELVRIIDERLETIGFKRDKEFKGHITLVRVKSLLNRAYWRGLLSTFKEEWKIEVKEFKLMKSTLTPNGPIYETVETFPLKSVL